MRRQIGALLTACLLASGAAPLAAIEYHAQGDTLADPVIESGDPLAEVQSQDVAQDAEFVSGDAGMVDGFCEGFCDCCCDACSGWGFGAQKSWIVRADAMWLRRSDPKNDTILLGDGNLIYSADLLGADDASGVDLSIMEVDPHGDGLEFRAMWLGKFAQTANLFVVDPIIVTIPLTDQITGNNNVDLLYESRVRTMELHKLEAATYGTWMYGVRYIDLDENLFIDTSRFAPGAPLFTRTSFSARNEMVGFQLGYGAMLYEHNCWRLQMLGKGGVYFNDADSNVQFVSNFGDFNQGGEATEEIAVASELRLTLMYQFAPGWAFRTGYELFFVDGVVLASEQIETTQNVISNDPIPTDINLGTVWYHGGFIGLEYNF